MEFWLIMVVVVVAVVGFFTEAPLAVLNKAILYGRCLVHMVATSDTKKTKDPKPVVKQQSTRGRRVRVVFVRHGESVWNSCFNKFGLGWPVRVIRALVRESVLWLTNAKDSVWIDSPLSADGVAQGQSLASFFASRSGAEIMGSSSSTIVVSNLRRAMETAALAAAQRAGPQDRIVIDSLLQEGTRNVDGASFCEAKKLPPGPMHGMESAASIARIFDGATHNDGNKPLKSSVHQRIDNFALRLFGECREGQAGYSTADGQEPSLVIAVGHSLWFKNFFNRFLPATSTHVAKNKKIQNCGVVALDIVADPNSGELNIDESTIRELYLGFSK